MITFQQFLEAAAGVAMAPAPAMARPRCANCGEPHFTSDHEAEMKKMPRRKQVQDKTPYKQGMYEKEAN